MKVHPHDHDRHDHGSELSEMQLRVRALETVLTEKGYIDPKALDAIVDAAEKRGGGGGGGGSSKAPAGGSVELAGIGADVEHQVSLAAIQMREQVCEVVHQRVTIKNESGTMSQRTGRANAA